jgi:phosphotransferase system  glucose/maltose/N-acetylglucosamine-specific IIC component
MSSPSPSSSAPKTQRKLLAVLRARQQQLQARPSVPPVLGCSFLIMVVVIGYVAGQLMWADYTGDAAGEQGMKPVMTLLLPVLLALLVAISFLRSGKRWISWVVVAALVLYVGAQILRFMQSKPNL